MSFEVGVKLFRFSFPYIISLEDTHYCGLEADVRIKVDQSFQISAKHLHLFLQSRFSTI